MHISVFSEEEFSDRAADIVCAVVRDQPDATIGLPSGSTPVGLYDELARRVRDGTADLSRVAVFAVDELDGVPPDHRATNASFFRERLTSRIPLCAFHILSSETRQPNAECERFQRLIEDAGGLDLAVLGIGLNGHIAFNEPGSSFTSRTRRVALAKSSREPYARDFGSLEATPPFGLTMGIADLLTARHALLLARGIDKATIVTEALEGPVTETVPASALQRHPVLTVVLDREAAAGLGKRGR